MTDRDPLGHFRTGRHIGRNIYHHTAVDDVDGQYVGVTDHAELSKEICAALNLTRALRPSGFKAEIAAVTSIVIRTLEEAAYMIPEGEGRKTLLETAAEVRNSIDPKTLSAFCCPFCQEVLCDPPCPLYEIRTALNP